MDDIERRPEFDGFRPRLLDIGRIHLRTADEREARTEAIVEGPAVGAPQMRREAAGATGRLVAQAVVRSGGRTVSLDDRRTLVATTEHGAERVKFALLCRDNSLADGATRGLTLWSGLLEVIMPEIVRKDRVVRRRLGDDRLMNEAPLPFVAVEKLWSTPPLADGRELPAEVDAISDAHVHPISAEWRMKVTRIADQEDAVLAIAVGDQAARDPFVVAEDFVGEIDAGCIANQAGSGFLGDLEPIRQPCRHEEPDVIGVHRPDEARRNWIDLPVHAARAVAMRFGEARRAEDDVIVARQAIRTGHLGADQVANRAAGTVGADQMARQNANFVVAITIAQSHVDSLAILSRRDEFGVEPNCHRGQAVGVLAQNLFQLVLRHPLAVLWIILVAGGRAV